MTTTSHTDCLHPATKAGRAACRRLAAKGYDRLHPAFDRPQAHAHIDACDDCGQAHRAEPAHEGRFGEGQLYAVVCGEFIEYYQASRVVFPA